MSFWLNKRETGSPYDAADKLFEAAVALSREPDRAQESELYLAQAIAAYRKLVPQTKGFEAKRRLAKALWRHATYTAEKLGRYQDALVPGREALELGRAVLAVVEPSHAAFDAIVQEVSGAMNDIAQIHFGASQRKERERLLLEAAAIARRSQGLGGRQALGTALHNIAQHRVFEQECSEPRSTELPVGLLAALTVAEQAFEIRMQLCEEDRAHPYFAWEYANSALQLGRLLCQLGRRFDASHALQAGLQRLTSVSGSTVDTLRDQLEAALVATCERPEPAVDCDEAMRSLGMPARVLLELIGALECDDRRRQLVELWFPDQWRIRVGSSPAPDFAHALAELTARGLVRVRDCAGREQHYDIGYIVERYVRAKLPDAVDFCLSRAGLFAQRFSADVDLPDTNPVRTGIAAAVYARRGGQYQASIDLLEHFVLGVACRRGEGRHVLAHLQLSAAASEDRVLLERVDRATEQLADAHFVEGNRAEALETVAYGYELALRHDLGVRILDWKVQRLALLCRMGRNDDVLTELNPVLEQLDGVPGAERVREAALHHGAGAAKALQQWQRALELNGAIVESLQARAASPSEVAAQRSYDYAGLLELNQIQAADRLLRECEAALQQSGASQALARVLGARGIVANRSGDSAQALQFKRRSLEMHYKADSSLDGLAHAHAVYGNQLTRSGELHWLTAAALYALIGQHAASAAELKKVIDSGRSTPRTYDELLAAVAQDGLPLQPTLQTIEPNSRPREVITDLLNKRGLC